MTPLTTDSVTVDAVEDTTLNEREAGICQRLVEQAAEKLEQHNREHGNGSGIVEADIAELRALGRKLGFRPSENLRYLAVEDLRPEVDG